MSVFRRRRVYRDGRNIRLFGGASIVTAVLAAGAIVLDGTASGNTTATTGSATGAIVISGPQPSQINLEVSGSGPIVLAGSSSGLQLSRGSATGGIVINGSASLPPRATGA